MIAGAFILAVVCLYALAWGAPSPEYRRPVPCLNLPRGWRATVWCAPGHWAMGIVLCWQEFDFGNAVGLHACLQIPGLYLSASLMRRGRLSGRP